MFATQSWTPHGDASSMTGVGAMLGAGAVRVRQVRIILSCMLIDEGDAATMAGAWELMEAARDIISTSTSDAVRRCV